MTHNQPLASDGSPGTEESLHRVRQILDGAATQDRSIPGDILPECPGLEDLAHEDEWRPSDATRDSRVPLNIP